MVNAAAGPRTSWSCAAGSLPGDLHRLWRPRDPDATTWSTATRAWATRSPGRWARRWPTRPATCTRFVGDGVLLMMSRRDRDRGAGRHQAHRVLVDNYGYGSIAALSEGPSARRASPALQLPRRCGQFADEQLPIDLAANAASSAPTVLSPRSADELRSAWRRRARTKDCRDLRRGRPKGRFGGSGAWWDVPVSEISTIPSTTEAREAYEREQLKQLAYLSSAGTKPDA